ncbi:MAG: hypothetical protein R2710_20705 [Acidimicrobiales bacterium]
MHLTGSPGSSRATAVPSTASNRRITRVRLTRVADGEGLTDAPVDHLQTSTGDEVVFFGVEEAARWRHELLP